MKHSYYETKTMLRAEQILNSCMVVSHGSYWTKDKEGRTVGNIYLVDDFKEENLESALEIMEKSFRLATCRKRVAGNYKLISVTFLGVEKKKIQKTRFPGQTVAGPDLAQIPLEEYESLRKVVMEIRMVAEKVLNLDPENLTSKIERLERENETLKKMNFKLQEKILKLEAK